MFTFDVTNKKTTGLYKTKFLLLLGLFSSFSLFPSYAAHSETSSEHNSSRPNVIIILADDLGWGDVGFNGSDIETPNLDRLASEGLRLERFYTTPFCSPTRAALMTGRDPMKLGMAYSVMMPWENGGVSLDEHFMSENFKAAGYNTALVGKWHLGHTIQQHVPNARGFDMFYGHMNTQVSYFDHQVAGGHDFQENGKSVNHKGEYATDVHGRKAAEYINQLAQDDKPFFMYVPFLAPHSPIEAREDVRSKYWNKFDIPGSPSKTYAAMVDSMDQAIGQILKTLDDNKIANNTIVLFFSDNGGFERYGADNGPYRGGKLEVFEGGVRVAAVMRWPEKIKAGTKTEAVMSVMDVMPTLNKAIGIADGHSKDIDGQDRWSSISSDDVKPRRGSLYFASNIPIYNKFQLGVLDGRWKLVQNINHLATSTDYEVMLFDIEADPFEENDLAEKQPGIVRRLERQINDWRALHPVGGSYVKISPHPGWRAPKDYADVIVPADQINTQPYQGFGTLESFFLQLQYGDKGRIIYE